MPKISKTTKHATDADTTSICTYMWQFILCEMFIRMANSIPGTSWRETNSNIFVIGFGLKCNFIWHMCTVYDEQYFLSS